MKKILLFVPIFLFFLMSLIFNPNVSAHELKISDNVYGYEEYNKNILYFSNGSGTVNGVSYNMIDGVIHLRGTATADGYINLVNGRMLNDITANNLINNYQGKKLSMWWDNNFNVIDGSTGELLFSNYSGSGTSLARIWNNNVANFTFSNTSRIFNMDFMVKKNTNYNDRIIKVMLVEGEYNKDNKLSFQPNLKHIYDSGYQHGKKEGYDEGYTDGLDEGYNNGYNDGLTNGYDNGYNQATEDFTNFSYWKDTSVYLKFTKNKTVFEEYNTEYVGSALKFTSIARRLEENSDWEVGDWGFPMIVIVFKNKMNVKDIHMSFGYASQVNYIFRKSNYIQELNHTGVVLSNIPTEYNNESIDILEITYPRSSDVLYQAYVNADNSYYYEGYNVGYLSGKNEGYNNGYTKGFELGKKKGYELGLIDGNVTENSILLSMFLGLANIPINILTSIFNFDLFGINLFSALTSLLSIGLVIFVIRKFFK